MNCENPPATHQCFVVTAALTVYSTQAVNDTVVDSVKDGIKSDMDAGQFDDAQKDIVKVNYIELANIEDGGTDGSTGGNPNEAEVGSSSSGIRVGVFVAAGLLMAVILGVAYSRRQKSSSEESDSELGTQPPPPAALPEPDTDLDEVPSV